MNLKDLEYLRARVYDAWSATNGGSAATHEQLTSIHTGIERLLRGDLDAFDPGNEAYLKEMKRISAIEASKRALNHSQLQRMMNKVDEWIAAERLGSNETKVAEDETVQPGEPSQQEEGKQQRFGEWRLLAGQKLGEGGQGGVTVAWSDQRMLRGALKLPTGKRSLTEKGQERFLREVQLFRHLEHPFVVRVLDVSEDPLFLVTEVAPFGSLHDCRAAFVGDLWRSLRLIRCVALGLAFVHKKLIHRDIKPKNILLHSLEHPLVADFGIAHFFEKETITSLGPGPGAFFFSPMEYELDDKPTAAFDVFSLGAVLHWLLCSTKPKRPYRLLTEIPQLANDLGRVYEPVDELLQRLLPREPGDRIQNVMGVVQAVDDVLATLLGRHPEHCTSCADGEYRDVGSVVLGSGTEINIYPPDAGTEGAMGLPQLSPRLLMCPNCGNMRVRAEKPKFKR